MKSEIVVNHAIQTMAVPSTFSLTLPVEVPMQAVDSSNIAAIGYHSSFGLVVQFQNGGVYAYPDVSPFIFASMLQAESKGKFLNEQIKSTFDFVKLS